MKLVANQLGHLPRSVAYLTLSENRSLGSEAVLELAFLDLCQLAMAITSMTFDDEGAQALVHFRQLQQLDLSSNHFMRDPGAAEESLSFCQQLTVLQHLCWINLSETAITPDAVEVEKEEEEKRLAKEARKSQNEEGGGEGPAVTTVVVFPFLLLARRCVPCHRSSSLVW
jgi:hypothetical protein